MKNDESTIHKIKKALKRGKKLTSLGALKMFRTMRLAAYVHKLRTEFDLDVKMDWVVKNGKAFGVYYLPKR